jgi:cysteinyl-tRNA synthetase
VLFRLLRHVYGDSHVIYVRNITDVDDKINARAAERGISIREVTEETYKNFKEDVAALGCLPPTVEPRATEHIEEMKTLIERLVKSGHAYVAEDHVLFHVASMKDYGRLSNRSLDEMIAGARVEVAPFKKDPMDFVLWKPSGPGEPAWPSPAAIKKLGRPGWHIECSAMSWKHLGETFDIHGGGIDLVFPHHENEIAQSRCAFQTPVMANFWMHNGFLQVEGEKMSKSLGNFVTMHELLKDWRGEVVRLNMLRTQYRQPLDWTVRGLQESDKVLQNWIDNLGQFQTSFADHDLPSGEVLNALCDDLNTPRVIAEMHRLANLRNLPSAQQLHQSLKLLGLVSHGAFTREERSEIVRASISSDERDRIDALLNLRTVARKSKNFKESDRIRDELLAMGVRVKDNPDGTTTPEFVR